MTNLLAIVIPAFRSRHLPETLESLSAQTDKRFRVYIGDDASQDPILECVSRFTERLSIDYHRFSSNLGSRELVAQWHRCIDLTKGEPWIWLFSDDDIAEPECVERFYEEVGHNDVDLYRFGLDIINDRSVHRSRPRDHPHRENNADFLRALLTDSSRAWRAQDHIFSRRAYDFHGGFVAFPNAIYSDYATWIKFSTGGSIYTIAGPRIRWRSHPLGTSTGKRESYREKWVQSLCMFMRWLQVYSEQNGTSNIFKAYGRRFFFRELACIGAITSRQRNMSLITARRVLNTTVAKATFNLYASILRYRTEHSKLWRVLKRVIRATRTRIHKQENRAKMESVTVGTVGPEEFRTLR